MESFTERHKVLIVDDDPGIRFLMKSALTDADLCLLEADSGEAALEIFRRCYADLVLLDVGMAGMDGFDCCRRLRGLPRGGECSIVMVTGMDRPEDIQLAFDAGATDFMTKPLKFKLFRHRVRYLLSANQTLIELKRNQGKLAKAQSIAKLGYWEWDFKSPFLVCSDELFRIFGHPREIPLTYRKVLRQLLPEDRSRLRSVVRAAIHHGKPYDIEYRVRLADGSIKSVNDKAEVVTDYGDGTIIGTVHDITTRKKDEEKISYYAYYDTLTNLPNRRFFIRQFETCLADANARQAALALLFIDLDRFKHVNDTYGHNVGDKVLCVIAGRIRKCLRNTDVFARARDDISSNIARLAGDEFTVLITDPKGVEHVEAIAGRLLEACARPIDIRDFTIYLSVSIGIALYPEDSGDAESLLQHADLAMYHAKEQGRNNYQFYNGKLQQHRMTRLNVEVELRRGLENGEFRLHFQPQVDAGCNLTGFEALVRWQHPQRGLLVPEEFIHIAESSGLIIPIGNWVLAEACREAMKWRETWGELTVGVNLSALQFNPGSLPGQVEEALAGSSLAPALLELEITESAIIKDIDGTFSLLLKLKEMGVKLAIDDFGTGYSSLNYLKRFPIDTLKIDKSFIDGIDGSARDAAIVRTILQLADNLGIGAIAEGVETQGQFESLVQMGCHWFQGYYFSKPLPAEQVLAYLAARAGGMKVGG